MTRLEAIRHYRDTLVAAARLGREADRERELCCGDLFYLVAVVLGRGDVNHDWLFERCREIQDNPNGYLDLWAREHYKSTLITFAKTIQDILCDPEITVGIFSFTRPNAKQFLRQIKREFEANDRLRELFPDIIWTSPHKDAPKWSEDDGIILKRRGNPKESTVEAWGLVDGQPTSKHFRLMVYDDVVTRESITTPEMIEKVTTAWAESRALRTEGGAVRYIGTRWHKWDTYRAILDRGAAVERRHPATDDGTEAGEPVLKSKEWLYEQRRDMGQYVFGAQMLLDPTADTAQGFKDAWLKFYPDGPHVGDGMNKYILVDPASEKKKTSDYTAMGVVGLSSDGNYYLLDLIRDRLNPKERIDALFALHRRWQPRAVGYEKYGMMSDAFYAKERMNDENYRFELIEVGGAQPKPDRIKRLVPLFEEGRIWLPQQLPKIDYEGRRIDLVKSFLDEEYRAFPVAAHDDMLDMLSRIFDIPVIWPKSPQSSDRYARNYRTSRHRSISFMAA